MRSILVLSLIGCSGGQSTVSQGSSNTSTAATTAASTTSDTAAELLEESFVAVVPSAHDILFVVDNSCSMYDNQDAMALSVMPLVDALNGAGLDWRIGVTSTDVAGEGACSFGGSNALDGRLSRVAEFPFMDVATPSPEIVFGAMARLGTNGSGCEKGLAAAYLAMEEYKDTENVDFVREFAGMHIVVLSDEEDHTEEDAEPVVTLEAFKDWMAGTLAAKQSISFSSVVVLVATAEHDSVGARYTDVTRAIGGFTHDIALQPYSDPMGMMGQAIATTATRSFTLAQAPVPSSVVVEVDGVTEAGFNVVGSAVVFDDAPAVGSAVVIHYIAE